VASPTIQVKGAKELRRAIRQAETTELAAELKAANREAAEVVAYEAQTIVPVKSGRLLETIRASGTLTAGVVRAGRASLPYAGPIHFGWPGHNIEPNPYLYDAADNRVDEVVEQYQAAIDRIADSIASSGANP
jgi:hypothetical protein